MSPCMDDSKVSSTTLDQHIEHMQLLCAVAKKEGFEFNATKSELNGK